MYSEHNEMHQREHEKCNGERRRKGAQTFRRGRALEFYRQLDTKRDTLKKQLDSNELQSIHSVIAGELKATEAIMNEFVVTFKLTEILGETTEE
ncbi:2-keto-3-deoxygluconate kinase [Solibacillus sp. R5-41]|uniref:2-keto-3-deoxygluconate kinase n=1 Tax=Solibacillus sp. R5-41 TaxID=2048654 RepID=UPI000C12999B|nr:2-keto-3-deoxygluconate kinase [Solibacillus sp. R5-41]ATP42172.1 2-keto-3-deoxygluconate kinase [Solibacillus sp. R5-41]